MKILVIEDDRNLVESLEDLLETEGYEVDSYYSIDDITDYIVLNKYDLIILDIMLGRCSGLDFLKMIRKEINRPIILLTAKDAKNDILEGFECGADDYITKPFDSDLLLARIKSRLRGQEQEKVRFEKTTFDLSTGVLKQGNKSINLTNTETEILKLLFHHRGQVLSKEKLINRISPGSLVTTKAVVSHIYNIRKKIMEIDGDDPIENKWGIGYLWKEQSNNR